MDKLNKQTYRYRVFLIGKDKFGSVNYKGSKSFPADSDDNAGKYVRRLEKNVFEGTLEATCLMREIEIR